MSRGARLAVMCACLLPWPAMAAAGGPEEAPSAEAVAAPEEEEEAVDGAPFLGGFIAETRILYPLSLGDWQAQGEHRYEQPELGVSVRYRHARRQDRWIDVYFYPAGVIPPERLAQEVDVTLHGIRGHGGYAQVEIGPVREYALRTGKGESRTEWPARSVSMSLQREGQGYSSAMVLLVKDLYFVKGRSSAQVDALKPARVQSLLEDFMAQLVAGTSLMSTGGCWMPPPIVAATSLDDKAEGALMNMRRDGELRVVAFADRIEAKEPDAPEAQVMQFMSMTASGRWIPGCNPPEDMTPDVPPGQREIRFEYRLPPERTDGNAPRLRGRRTGVG